MNPASAKELRLLRIGGTLPQHQAALLAGLDSRRHRAELAGLGIRLISPGLWRSRTSAGFQDFIRLESTARESVGAGDLERVNVPGAVESAVRRADAEAVVATLPDGLASPLGTSYEDAGGQWQRIALSRAMMREAPVLLLLV